MNEVVIAMNFPHLPRIATLAGCLTICLPAAVAQNSILLLNDSLIEPTASTTSSATPYVFQSTIQELTCPSSGRPRKKQKSNRPVHCRNLCHCHILSPRGAGTRACRVPTHRDARLPN